ncbi:MAG TPA: hypothetical protein VKU80_18275 [Planctomycetota bacterium]|nr:hypothetical protein [Planctomycetota bacterium]
MAARSKLGKWRVGYSGTQCPRCRTFKRHEDLKTGTQSCGNCHGFYEAVRFDPVQPAVAVPQLAGVGPKDAAPCARHVRNQAVASCARCGQFMCSLCKIDADGNVYCPPCFDRLSTEGSIPGGAMRLKNYSGLAAACFLASPFVWFVSPVTVSLGIFFSIRGIKDKKVRGEQDGVARLYALLILNIFELLAIFSVIALIFGAFAARGK